MGKGKHGRTRKLKRNGRVAFLALNLTKKTLFSQMYLPDYLFTGPSGEKCIGPSPSGLPIPCLGMRLAPIASHQVKVPPLRRRHRH